VLPLRQRACAAAGCASWQEGFVYYVDPVMYLRALADCLDQNMDVVNLSIGGPGEPDAQEQRLFDALIESGVTVVAAMGNEREEGSPISYPAAIPGVVAVGATNVNDSVTAFSNRGDHITLCAPGKAIWSTLPTYDGNFGFAALSGAGGRPIKGRADRRETDYDAWDGTSMAAPHVAAAAALVIARHGPHETRDMHRRLKRSADRVARMGKAAFHPDYGAGRLNLLNLLR
jgi:subtilisin family serine protease